MLGADRVAAAGGSPSEQLAMLGDELLDVIHRYPDHVWVFLHEFPALTDERAEQFRVRRREYERRVEAVLQAGIDAGEFRDIDPRLTALAWLGMHNYTYLWLKPAAACRRATWRSRSPTSSSGGSRSSSSQSSYAGAWTSNPRSPPSVPPTSAARSSAGTSPNCFAISSRLPRNVPSACG